jgi:hypothetical protein
MRDRLVRSQHLKVNTNSHRDWLSTDIKENQPLHTGIKAPAYWEAIHEVADPFPEMANLMSGAHSVISMHIGKSYLDPAVI